MKIKRGLALVAVLGACMAGLWLWVLGILPPHKTVSERVGRPLGVQVSPEGLRKRAEETTTSLSTWLQKQAGIDKMLVYHQGPRDPFLSPVGRKQKKAKKTLSFEPPKFTLKGIAWDENEPLALINGLLVKEGDTVQGAQIVKIDFDRVAVRYGSKRYFINLIEWEEKTLKP